MKSITEEAPPSQVGASPQTASHAPITPYIPQRGNDAAKENITNGSYGSPCLDRSHGPHLDTVVVTNLRQRPASCFDCQSQIEGVRYNVTRRAVEGTRRIIRSVCKGCLTEWDHERLRNRSFAPRGSEDYAGLH